MCALEGARKVAMGVQDREYWRETPRRRWTIALFESAVSTIIAASVAVWVVQVFGGPSVTRFLAASPEALSRWQIYRLVTAFFAHSPESVWHIVWNMLFLYFFGRELEQIYGRRAFAIFYFAAGTVSILAEVAALAFLQSNSRGNVIGASGAVMGVVVLFALFYPTRQILFLFFIPLPVWALCVLFVIQDLAGLAHRGSSVANVAHLAGAAVGLAYWFLDVRNLRRGRRLFRGLGRARWKRRREAETGSAAAPGDAETAEVSRRIDALLEKISAHGKESLSEEEWAFLKENSSRYRS